MRCVLALDQGGSKCEAALFRDDGELLGWGRAQQVGESGRSHGIALKAAKLALKKTQIDELHLISVSSGISFAAELGLPVSCNISISYVPEHCGALALVDEKYGIVIVAGTGARLFGINREGRQVFIDGLGPVLGDVGSGYHIGYLGLRAAVRGILHPRHATSLTEKIFDAYCKAAEGRPSHGSEKGPVDSLAKSKCRFPEERTKNPLGQSLGEMIAFSLRNHDRSVIASLSGIVDAEARSGDAVATGILHDASAQMAENIRDLADHLKIGNDRYAMVGTGSVAMKSDIYWQHLCTLVKEFAPGLEPVRSPLPPVAGVGLYQLLRLEGVDPVKVRTTLFSSVRNLKD